MDENRKYHLSTSEKDGIVEFVITGDLETDDLDLLRQEILSVLKEKKPGAVLCDVNAVKGPHEIISAYFRVRSIPSDVIHLPVAIVDVSADRDFESFHEVTAANVGQLVKYFTGIEEARAWLKGRLKKAGR